MEVFHSCDGKRSRKWAVASPSGRSEAWDLGGDDFARFETQGIQQSAGRTSHNLHIRADDNLVCDQFQGRVRILSCHHVHNGLSVSEP